MRLRRPRGHTQNSGSEGAQEQEAEANHHRRATDGDDLTPAARGMALPDGFGLHLGISIAIVWSRKWKAEAHQPALRTPVEINPYRTSANLIVAPGAPSCRPW